MTKDFFTTLVHKHFDFLVDEFDYVILKEYQSSDKYDSGYIEYHSAKASIRVEKDGQNIFISIAPEGEPEIARQYLPTVLEALSLSKEKDFPQIVSPTEYENVLKFYSFSLKNKCENILRGDFSQWLEILRFHITKRKKDYFSWSGKELPSGVLRKLDEYIRSKSN